MTVEESEAADRANITVLRERMSRLGMKFLLSHDSKGRNVLHKLLHINLERYIVQNDFVDFIRTVLGRCPALISQTDFKGDTPVHVLVRNHPQTSIHVALSDPSNTQQKDVTYKMSSLLESSLLSVLVELCHQCILTNQEEASLDGVRYDTIWLVQNTDGNTPLHEALIATNHGLAMRLLEHDQRSAGLVNKRKETPLHLLTRHPLGNAFILITLIAP